MSPWAPLPGDPAAVRGAAADLHHVVPQLRTAHVAAVRLEEVLAGEHWRGEAFDAFRGVVERKPLPAALAGAIDAMGEAAQQLLGFAARFEANQRELDHLRRQAEAVQASLAAADPTDLAAVAAAEAAAAELRSLELRAQAVHDEHRAATTELGATLDRLSEEPTFAQPPPSTWERFTGAVSGAFGAAWSFGTGVVEGVRDLVVGIYELASLLNPARWPELWANRGQIAAVLQYAWEHPGEFLGQLGSALLDLETLREDPARWLGRRVPELLLSLATVGAGTVGARAAASVRGLQGLRLADRLQDRTSPLLSAAHSAERLRAADGLAGRYVRIGVDETRLAHHGTGAFARTDTPLGRLAVALDAGVPGAGGARQLPGLVLDEIRGFTDIPVDATPAHLPDRVVDLAGPTLKRSFASWATNGLTADLGMLDGLLVGAPALSPGAYASIAGVQSLSIAERAVSLHDLVQAVQPVECAQR